ncbi:MAG: Do family serine endopeptidase [Bdellovibrionota bacterium]
MNKFLSGLCLVALLSTSSIAEEKLWTEGSDQPNARVNTDLKTLSPKAYLSVSEKVNQSVVNISTTQTVKGIQSPFGFQQNPFGGQLFGDEFLREFFGQGQPRNRKEASLGSGFVLNREGYIVTNNHVIAKADEIRVTFYDETESVAKLIGRDPKTDVALLKVDRLPAKLEPVLLGDSDAMKVGEIVIAIGNPFGLSHSVTQGIISAKERAIGMGPYDDFIQTDASINPGNSGGPLLNINGEVIGINSAMHAGGQGIGFAIPINTAKEVIRKLRQDGKVIRAQLGVQIQKLGQEHVKALKLKNNEGALVTQVMDGSPAAVGGIKPGDVIVGIDGRKIKDYHTLPMIVSNQPVGKRVKVDLIRNSTAKTVIIQLTEMKDEDVENETMSQGNQPEKDALGIVVQNLTKEIAQSIGLSVNQKGVIIAELDNDSIAASKGVRRGDVIVEVNRKNVSTVDEYTSAVKNLKKGDSVLLLIVRKQGTTFVAFEIP